jgi:hypothetical protein
MLGDPTITVLPPPQLSWAGVEAKIFYPDQAHVKQVLLSEALASGFILSRPRSHC